MKRIREAFYVDTPVEYNISPVGVALNLIIGFIRLAVFLPTVTHVAVRMSYTCKIVADGYHHLPELSSAPFQVFALARVCCEAAASFAVMYDCVDAGPVLMGFGSFRERMKISVLAWWAGLGGHIGVMTMRMMLYSV
eukprot:530440_1